MDTAVLIWIIVGVLVVAIIVVVALAVTARGRAEKKRQAEHDEAEKLRADAHEKELAARESEAKVAKTRADAASAAAAAQQAQAQAAQADLDARRLADSLDEHTTEAEQRRAEHEETLRKADEVDPYVTTAADSSGRDADDSRDADADRGHDRNVDAGDGRADVREERVASSDGIPQARDGVVGGDPADADRTHEAPTITRPRAATAEVPVNTTHDDGSVPPSRRDSV